MKQVKHSLRSLTRVICGQLEGVEIPTRPVWTVVDPPDGAPYVARDVERPALAELRVSLSIGLLRMPEYKAVAEFIEKDPELSQGILVDDLGFLTKPEANNITRALVTNFLWRYLREGKQLDWDEERFAETINELEDALDKKTATFHTIMPLSNLKMEVTSVDFGGDLKLRPASLEELEAWINRDRSMASLTFGGPPEWNTHYVDKPGVLHARRELEGRPRPTDLQAMLGGLPQMNAGNVITALRLVLNAPIRIILQESRTEGLMAWGGGGTSWSWDTPPSPFETVENLDQEKAAQVIHIWQRLQKSPNIDRLRLPLRRWESSLLRPSFEDRLIDAWISLENLLLKGQDGELTYRAAVRLAEFLGTSGADRNAIYKAAKDSYSWRSKIVHGSTPDKRVAKRQPLQEAVRLTTEYVRSALLKVLDLPGQFDPDRLEADLLSRESGP